MSYTVYDYWSDNLEAKHGDLDAFIESVKSTAFNGRSKEYITTLAWLLIESVSDYDDNSVSIIRDFISSRYESFFMILTDYNNSKILNGELPEDYTLTLKNSNGEE